MTTYNPRSTYRLQFNSDFTLTDAENIIRYLDKTGVKTVYASPVFQAVQGSMHGYDVTNPLKINAEIGGEDDFGRVIDKLHARKMGWIQDIVPNHMAYSPQNPWIADVLELGEESEYVEFFDIQLRHFKDQTKGKLMLPFFGQKLDALIERNELSAEYSEAGFQLKYYENTYPVSKNAYNVLLNPLKEERIPIDLHEWLIEKDNLPWDRAKQKLFAVCKQEPEVIRHINHCLSIVNSNSQKMMEVMNQLFYWPTFWKETEKMINYRRFFTINSLICVNVQHEKVFDATHKMIADWIKKKLVDGIRVDHIDGLFNPSQYLGRLRKLAGEDTHITIEKILEKDENLPTDWPIEGTTGYDFLALVNNLLTNPEKGPVFYSYYNNWIKKTDEYRDVFHKKNRFILYNRFKGELINLTQEWRSISADLGIPLQEENAQRALGEFLVFCPVYKIYQSPSVFSNTEMEEVNSIIDAAITGGQSEKDELEKLRNLFLLKNIDKESERKQIDTFFRHCMQFTGPLMAKGIEDTAFYSYNPFIGHNEVGDSPGFLGIRTETFHQLMQERQTKEPLTLDATSTHDTKRGEDARARLNVLSDVPEKWIEATKDWRILNKKFKIFDDEREMPTANDEYFIYQVLCAHWPMGGLLDETFIDRLTEYLVKAMREAKVNSSWSDPDESYETETIQFVRNVLSEKSDFRERFQAFVVDIIPHGIVNSLTQLILKNTCPGVPDTYQGCERWNLSFVDPDNRQPVDYAHLESELDEMIRNSEVDKLNFANRLMQEPESGRIKQWITYLTLKERKDNEKLFQEGSYVPLEVEGKYKKHLIAFYRQFQEEYFLVILPLNTAALPTNCNWEDTWILMPELKLLDWQNLLSNEFLKNTNKLEASRVFGRIQLGLFRGI
ncbi:malto-oligosyltrehalose synthase [Sunxiuqinia indica]|uniref:malto-oligosyltrehalose synthase n=1 Tax=Sunxiuqinia indica TaxID=2692584 RepID=UPI00135CE5E9|nr:malto-oligosyltrehalose synthase [Sunxiuqinia indica]